MAGQSWQSSRPFRCLTSEGLSSVIFQCFYGISAQASRSAKGHIIPRCAVGGPQCAVQEARHEPYGARGGRSPANG
jgi:hypothetical protein